MIENSLSIEQMKHLAELGLDTNDASLYEGKKYGHFIDAHSYHKSLYAWHLFDIFEPVYTLQDILNKFDAYILYHFKNGTVALEICIDTFKKEVKEKDTELNVAYKMLCYCIENGYIK